MNDLEKGKILLSHHPTTLTFKFVYINYILLKIKFMINNITFGNGNWVLKSDGDKVKPPFDGFTYLPASQKRRLYKQKQNKTKCT